MAQTRPESGENQQTLFLFLVIGAGIWIGFGGWVSAGWLPLVGWMTFAIVPLVLCWLAYAALRLTGQAPKWTLWAVLALTILTYPLMKQPWNPRHVFVSTLTGLRPGTTVDEVRRRMARYTGGDLIESRAEYQPEELRNRGITHQMSFRWNEVDGEYNADSGQVFLRNGVVVGTRFLAD